VRTPTQEELENCELISITLEAEWDPQSSNFQEIDDSLNDNLIDQRSVKSYISQSFCNEIIDNVMKQISSGSNHLIGSTSSERNGAFANESTLAKTWVIGQSIACETLKATMQSFIRSALYPIEWRFRTKQVMLRYNRLNCKFYSDTFFSNQVSVSGNKCCQLFVSKFGFAKFTPMKLKSEAGYALQDFIREVGIPTQIHTDNAKELTLGVWKQTCRDANILMTQTEKGSPWQNWTEVEIREIKKHTQCFMTRSNTSLALWDFCCQYTVELHNRLARPLPQLKGRTPYELLTGNTPDISEFLEFTWYQPVWYYKPAAYPEHTKHLARWLGIAHRISQALCYWLLPISGVPIACTTIQALSTEELGIDNIKSQLKSYDLTIEEKFSHDHVNPQNLLIYREDQEDDLLGDVPVEPESLMPNIEDTEADMYDSLLLTESILVHNGETVRAKVIGHKRNQDSNPIGIFHPNPLLNTRVYLAEFLDGHIVELSANAIAEAIYGQIDEDAYDLSLFKDIIGHEQDSTALSEDETQLINDLQDSRSIRNSNNMNPLYTMRGWKICIEWQDSTTSWLPLVDVKNSFPVHLAQYAVENNLHNLPAFSWWVKYTLKKKKAFIKATKSTYSQRTHKFGIKVPKTVQEALAIDQQMNTNYW
jgi:hypothetical protein